MQTIKPTLSVEFYKESNSKEPVREWLKSLDKNIRTIVGEDICKVQFRWPLGMPLVRSLGDGIHEVRINIPNGIIRILFMVRGLKPNGTKTYAKEYFPSQVVSRKA